MMAGGKAPRWLRAPLRTCAMGVLLSMGSFRPAHGAEASRGAAVGDTVCLEWDTGGATDCPTVEQLEASVGEILGRPVAGPSECSTRMAGSIRPSATGGWTVALHFATRTGEPLGERSFDTGDATCSTLKDPLSLVIALMVEGNGGDTTALHLKNRPVTNGPVLRSTLASPPRTTELSVAGTVSSGLLPGVGFGATIGIASRAIVGLPLRFDATFWFPTAKAGPGPDGTFWSLLGDIGFCPSIFHTKRFAALACGQLVAGTIHGEGIGLSQNERSTRPFGAVELSADLIARLSQHVSATLSVGVAASWLRPRFVYVDSDGSSVLLHQPAAIIPLAALGIDFASGDLRGGGASP